MTIWFWCLSRFSFPSPAHPRGFSDDGRRSAMRADENDSAPWMGATLRTRLATMVFALSSDLRAGRWPCQHRCLIRASSPSAQSLCQVLSSRPDTEFSVTTMCQQPGGDRDASLINQTCISLQRNSSRDRSQPQVV